ncbi:MAG: tetratricopeptide repeat protein [Thermoplasmata archaeon]|nr:tetratricopeptide repeat protein [Thermoplasmata archaeon]
MMEDLLKRPLPAEKRLLLYLLPYRAGSDLYEAPQEVGQDAISIGIGIRKDNLPRILKKLKDEKVIEERTMHMKGYARRRKAYFLTEKGRYLAEELYHQLVSLPITVRLEGGGVRRVALKDAMMDYSISRREILSILNLIWEGRGTLNEIEAKELAKGTLPQTAAFIDEAPIPKVFYGREKELRELSEWCDEEPSGFYVITGIAGIGKTTLAAEFIRRQRTYYNIFWKKIRRWDSLKSILSSLSFFLQSLGRPRLKSLLASEKGIQMGEAVQILRDDLNGSDSILVFDDFQRASDELLNFFSSLKEALEDTTGVKILLIGRHIIPIYDRREVILEKYVREMVLEGLDEESSKKLLGEKVKDDEVFQRIYTITKGHPLFLKIISTTREPVGEIDIKRYIYEEIFKNLTQEEIDLLSVASIYRLPVSSSAFFIKEDIDFKTIDNLVEKNLLQEISYDMYEVHDIIKEFFYRRLTPVKRRRFHRAAAQYYLEQGEKRLLVEAAYHYIRASEVYKALKILLTHGEDLISLGMTDEFYSTLLKINEKDVPGELKANYFYLKGEAEVILGRWDAALKTLKSALKTAENVGDDLVAADSARLLGYILIRRGERMEALSHFKRALKEATSMGDRRRRALALIDLGELHSIFGDFPKAEEYLKKSASSIHDMQDDDLLAKAYVSLGILYTNWERYEEAVKMFNLALSHLKKTDNPFEYGRLKSNLGILYTKQGKYNLALKNFEEAIKAYEGSGEVRQLGYALAGSGEASLKIGDYKTAEGRLLEGLSIFRKLGERLKIATTSFTLGELYLKLGDHSAAKEYFEECWATLNRMQNPHYLKHYEKKVKEHLSKLK